MIGYQMGGDPMITVVEPGWELLMSPVPSEIMRHIEACGRTCYKSEDPITPDSADKFVWAICRKNHVSILEHQSISVRIICSRACSHQIVLHQLASYSQESQRHCNYSKKGFQVIAPPALDLKPGEYDRMENLDWFRGDVLMPELKKRIWLDAVSESCGAYYNLITAGIRPEDARFVLPNACKTELVMTANLRTWRHIFRERGLNPRAQWEIQGIFRTMYQEFKVLLPSVFGDLE